MRRKNGGFILKYLITLLTFVMGVFMLLQSYIGSYAESENLEKREMKIEGWLSSVGDIFFYEMAMVDKYMLEGAFRTIEEYFYTTDSGDDIYSSYENLKNSNTEDGKMVSLGGYRISYMNPPLENLRDGWLEDVTFRVAKNLEVVSENRTIFRIKIESGYLRTKCIAEHGERKIGCRPLPKIEELSALGEEVEIE